MTKQDAVCSGILMYQGFKIGQKKLTEVICQLGLVLPCSNRYTFPCVSGVTHI
jgi:hypothetical protein